MDDWKPIAIHFALFEGSIVRPSLYALERWQKYVLLTALYFAQGVPFGLFVQVVPVILREADYSLEFIGLTSLLALPWGLKFLWSPWVDRPLGGLPRRKGWLLPILTFTVVGLGVIAQIDPEAQIPLLLGGVLVMNFLNATQDIATDGLAVDLLDVDERGIGNGIQVGGYRLGMLFGGAAILILIESVGWTTGLFCAAAGIAVSTLPLLFVREGESAIEDVIEHTGFKTLWSYIKTPGVGRFIAVIALFKLGDALGGGMIRPMLVDQGFSKGEIGEIAGGVGFTAALVGTLIGAIVTDRLSRRAALVTGTVFQAFGAAIYILVLVQAASYQMVAGVIAVENALGSIATVMLFACMMDWSRTEHSGADYTLLASVVVAIQGLGSLASGFTAGAMGYVGHHALAGVIALVGGLAAAYLYRQR